jgi:hypothetical protein
MDPLNSLLHGFNKMLADTVRAFREIAARRRSSWTIPRVFSTLDDDTNPDDAPDSLVGARLRPRRPLGGSAIALPEPDDDPPVEAIGGRARQ